ncbi:MAG: efflux RND transporter periplasmic adaptor subunit [Acidobacteriota bacterium]|nr:efflux RND transporter periplasmic adaptor subunit [Acidobacteriota bacterium]
MIAILAGSLALAGYMISIRPEPQRREPSSHVPFAVTEPVTAGAGAIPVLGAGTVRPRAEVDVAAEVSGRVVWVAPVFQSGGRIRGGQAIFRIDDAEYRNRVNQAGADIAVQQVELLRVQEEARIARSQYEKFRRRRAGSDPAVDAGPLAFWQPQLEAAQAVLKRHEATLAEAELLLSRTEIRAPFDGVVRSESLDVGQFVTAGQGVGRLYASDAVEVVVPLSDAAASLLPDLWGLRAGEDDWRIPARVVAEYGGGRYAWRGYVDRFETALDEQTRTLDVIVHVPFPFAGGSPAGADGGNAGSRADADVEARGGPPLLVGMFVDVEIEGLAPVEYFKVRRPALRPGNEVWEVRDGAVTIVPVRVLQRADDEVYVTGALEDGAAVVVGGIQMASEGMAVRTETGGGS